MNSTVYGAWGLDAWGFGLWGGAYMSPAPPMQRDGTGGFRRARIFRRDNSDDMAAIAVALQVLGADMISEAEAEQLEIAGVVQVLDAVGWFG